MATIFISHASSDRDLAIKLKRCIEKAFLSREGSIDVFCSSDLGDIEGGKEWFPQIVENLKQSKVCISLLTPQSVFFSPWMAYESGGAYLRFAINSKESRLFPIAARGIRGESVPQPFSQLQLRHLSSRKEIATLLHEVGACIHRKPAKLTASEISELSSLATSGAGHWENVHTTIVGTRQDSSPLTVDALLPYAKTDLFCAGFNLLHIATTPALKRDLIEFLQDSSTRTVRLLLSDPSKPRNLRSWANVGASYLDDLRQSVREFGALIRLARNRKIAGKLDVRIAPFVSVTMVCVDAESSDAQLVITPVIHGRALSAERPHFWLSRRRQPLVFSHYLNTYEDVFRRARPLG